MASGDELLLKPRTARPERLEEISFLPQGAIDQVFAFW
jgi:hypothetical protein